VNEKKKEGGHNQRPRKGNKVSKTAGLARVERGRKNRVSKSGKRLSPVATNYWERGGGSPARVGGTLGKGLVF